MKDDFSYSGIPFKYQPYNLIRHLIDHRGNGCCGNKAKIDTRHPDPVPMPYYFCMKDTSDLYGGTTWGSSSWNYMWAPDNKMCAMNHNVIKGLKTGATVKCKDFNLAGRLVDPKALYTVEEAKKIWAADLEAFGKTA